MNNPLGLAEMLFGKMFTERDTGTYLADGKEWVAWDEELNQEIKFKIVTVRLETKAQKRKALEEYYQFLTRIPWDKKWKYEPQRVALHEGEHAVADPGAGYYGIVVNPQDGSFLGGFYQFDGKRNPEEIIKLNLAPQERIKDRLSSADRRNISQGIQHLRKQ